MKCSEMNSKTIADRCISDLNSEFSIDYILNIKKTKIPLRRKKGDTYVSDLYDTDYLKLTANLDSLENLYIYDAENLYDEIAFGYIEGIWENAIKKSIYRGTATILYKLFGKDKRINSVLLNDINHIRKGFKRPIVVNLHTCQGCGPLTSYLVKPHGDVLTFTKLQAPFRFTTKIIKIEDIKKDHNVLRDIFKEMIYTAYLSGSFYEEFTNMTEEENKELAKNKYELYCEFLKKDLLPKSGRELKKLEKEEFDYYYNNATSEAISLINDGLF